jgi:hypothetical protein
LTPKLFKIIGDILNLDGSKLLFIEASSLDEFKKNVANLEGNLWISVTSPLKHSIGKALGISELEGTNSINQLMRIEGKWSGTDTDGYGFLAAAEHIGIEPKNSILKLRGGGSTARSIAAAWSEAEGEIIPIEGRRKLVSGPWDISIIDDCEADIAVDLDAKPGADISSEIDAKEYMPISYNEDSKINNFAVIMVVAQHLEAWKRFFLNNSLQELPTLNDILEKLSVEL